MGDDLVKRVSANAGLGTSWAACEANLAALREYNAVAWVRSDLQHILADPERFATVHAASFVHPNGFDILVLHSPQHCDRPELRCRIRLHVWWSESSSDSVGDIHNHAWDFCSGILAGSMRFRTFDIAAAREDAAEAALVRLWYDVDRKTVSPRGLVSVQPAFDAALIAGTSYAFEHHRFHTIDPQPGVTTCTLVVCGPYQRRGSELLAIRSRAEESQQTFNGAKRSSEDFRARLVRILQTLP